MLGVMNDGSNDATLVGETRRDVAARIQADIVDTATLVFAIAVADHYERADEALRATLDGDDISIHTIAASHHGRLHLLRDVAPGRLVMDYRATVVGAVDALESTDLEWFDYIRPSRYCESDQLGPFARAEFAGLHGADLVAGVSSWVGTNIRYVPGSSRPIDGAVATLLAREGVCRDFAHLTAALLRANDVAARVVAVYAPGLAPMDFHAVAEAFLDGTWQIVDPTSLAPRQSMVRIATGADAADIAFLTNVGGAVELVDMQVGAVVSPTLPFDDITERVALR